MKGETLLIKMLGLLMLSFFCFDSYRKYTRAEGLEGDQVRTKYA